MRFDDPQILVSATLIAVALVALVAAWLLSLRRRRARPAARAREATPWVTGLAKTRGTLARRLLESWRSGEDTQRWLADVEGILLTSDVGGARNAERRARGAVGGITASDPDGRRQRRR